jgi:2-methylcitrate dehydratase PrpD
VCFGAAAAAGKLMGLNEQQMLWALGLAAAQPVGLQEMFGTMTKSFHPGRAAQNGLTSAFMASRNFTSSLQSLEARYGWANVLSTARNYTEITGNLGSTWEIAQNTYKPFACGIVMHPTIDGCIQLRNEHKLTAAAVDRIDLRVHPLVLELTGKKTPATGSNPSSASITLRLRRSSKVVVALRSSAIARCECRRSSLSADRVTATVDNTIKEEQVRITVMLRVGRRLEKFVEHAVGSVGNPISDKDLEVKFEGLAGWGSASRSRPPSDGNVLADRTLNGCGHHRSCRRALTSDFSSNSPWQFGHCAGSLITNSNEPCLPVTSARIESKR